MTFRTFDFDCLTKLRLCLLFPVSLSASPEKRSDYCCCPAGLATRADMWQHHHIRTMVTNLFCSGPGLITTSFGEIKPRGLKMFARLLSCKIRRIRLFAALMGDWAWAAVEEGSVFHLFLQMMPEKMACQTGRHWLHSGAAARKTRKVRPWKCRGR